jgi:hypothetical protein
VDGTDCDEPFDDDEELDERRWIVLPELSLLLLALLELLRLPPPRLPFASASATTASKATSTRIRYAPGCIAPKSDGIVIYPSSSSSVERSYQSSAPIVGTVM